MYEKNKTKKELVTEVCERLNKKGFKDYDQFGCYRDFEPDDNLGQGLTYLPLENLIKLHNCSIDDYKEFKEVYQAWGRCGALRFTPYEVDEDDNPSLVLRHDRFLHMFRGYHFQASVTVEGIGDCGSGSYRTNFLVRNSHYQRIMRKGLISYLLWWAALIDVGFRFDNFIEAFNKDKAPIEKFLSDCMQFWGGPSNYKWEDIEPYITIGVGNIDIMSRKMYQLNNDGVVAYLAIGKKSVQVETADNTLLTIQIPDLNEGANYDLEDEDDITDFEDEVSRLEENHYLEMIAVMALKLAGIHISFINYYALRGRKKAMRPINSPDVINVKSLNDIYGCVPDGF